MTRVPCLVVKVKIKFVHTKNKIGSQVLLAFTSSNVLLGRGSEMALNECLEVSNDFPTVAEVQIW